MKRIVALLLCTLLSAPGCAAVTTPYSQRTPSPPRATSGLVDPALMAEYVRQLPVGSRIKVTRKNGDVLHGTLMKRDADPIVVQRRTRLPEAPLTIPVADIVSLQLQSDGSVGRTIGIGVAAGAGAALGVLLLLAAIFAD
jgi:hypothetical protein